MVPLATWSGYVPTSISTRGPGTRSGCWSGWKRHSRVWPSLPRRGRYPAELADLGILEYREVSAKPYRVIYGVNVDSVDVLVIADGRREMQALLQRRLLQA